MTDHEASRDYWLRQRGTHQGRPIPWDDGSDDDERLCFDVEYEIDLEEILQDPSGTLHLLHHVVVLIARVFLYFLSAVLDKGPAWNLAASASRRSAKVHHTV